MKRIVRFLSLCISLRSVSSAVWVDQYENFKPHHGK
jgi:hypothetical protein